MIECSVGGDASRPGFEAECRVEAGMHAVDAPEGFDGEVFSRAGVADDADDPAIDLTLVQPEQRLKGVEIAVRELPQHVG